MNDSFKTCIEACQACALACDQCAEACLSESDLPRMAACIRLDRDCAQICATAVRFMASNSPYARHICEVCALICEACAAECGKHPLDHCQRCAEACRQCAEACRAM